MISALADGTETRSETTPIADAIESLAFDLLTASHAGWENNDGAYGEFRLDVAAGRSRSIIMIATLRSNPAKISGEEGAMGHCYHHALSSVRKWGGAPEDYLALHQ